jgi:undecaprenyl pyrophosphate phosphatase UppP
VLGVALLVGRATILADLPPGVSRPAVAAVYDALTATLRHVAWTLFALGLLVAAVTWLTRRRAAARLLARRSPRPAVAPTAPAGTTAPTSSGTRGANPSLQRRVVD